MIIKVSFMPEVHPVTGRKRRLFLTTQNRCLPSSCPLSFSGNDWDAQFLHSYTVWLCFLPAGTDGMPHDTWLKSPFFNCVVPNVF